MGGSLLTVPPAADLATAEDARIACADAGLEVKVDTLEGMKFMLLDHYRQVPGLASSPIPTLAIGCTIPRSGALGTCKRDDGVASAMRHAHSPTGRNA